MSGGALDLFAGAGGWDIACSALGIAVDGVENMPAALATREAAGLSTVHDDVWTAPPDLGNGYEGLIASPPCQTFSNAGRGTGYLALKDVRHGVTSGAWRSMDRLRQLGIDVGDERTALVLVPLHYATTYPFRWLAWEQVPQVRPVWEACATVLRALGWHVWTGLVTAEQYGVPQTRKRAVLLARRTGQVGRPLPTHSKFNPRSPSKLEPGLPRWVSMADALGWGLDRVGWPRLADDMGDHVRIAGTTYRARDLRSANLPAFTLTEKARSWVRFPADAVEDYDPRKTLPDGSPRWKSQTGDPVDTTWPDNRPSTTVASRNLVQHPGSTANRYQPGVTKSRNDGIYITVPEASVLQSFPADFPWQGSRTKQYLQVGNAVPPGMAAALLRVAAGHQLAATPPRPKWHRWGDTLPLFDLEAHDPTEGETA